MAKFSLRRYDSQALVSVLLSALAVVPLIAMAYFMIQNFEWEAQIVIYGPTRRIAIFGAAAAAIGLAVLGSGFGFNSAGQRRNDKGRYSWLGFFTGAAVISLTFGLLALFFIRGEAA